MLTTMLRCGLLNLTTTKPMRRRISRAEYETIKTHCAARIKLRMEQLNLSPSDVQRLSILAVTSGKQQAGVSMAELAAWRGTRQLPKGAKLHALAALLQDEPDSFVPRDQQIGRSLVQRHMKATLDEANGGYHIKVTASSATPGHAYVETRILLPTDKAYKLAAVLNHTNSVEVMRRMGMKEDEIKETLVPRPVAHTEDGTLSYKE